MPNHAIVLLASCFLFIVSCDEFEIRDLKLDRKNLLFNSRIAEEWAGMAYSEIVDELGEPFFIDPGIKHLALWDTDDGRRSLHVRFDGPKVNMIVDLTNLHRIKVTDVQVYINDWRERFYKN